MSRVLVLAYRQGIDDAVRRRGLDPFFVVERMKPQLAGRDVVRVADVENVQEVLRAVLARTGGDLAGVVTGHEEGVFTAAAIRAALGIPGDRDAARTLRFRDKYLQKQALPADVPRADCEYVTAESSFTGLAARLGEPFVVKPANGFGARRTSVIRTPQDLAAYWEGEPASPDLRCVGESFVSGDEIHVDGLWQDGLLQWSCLSRYLHPPIGCNNGAVLADALVARADQPELYAEADALTERALRGLGAPDTVFHLEAYRCTAGRHAGRLVFGECAIRVGGTMVPEVIELTYGADLYELAVGLALGERAEPPPRSDAPQRLYGYVYLRRVPGVGLTEADFRSAFPELHELKYPSGPDAPTGAYGRVGHAFVVHEASDPLFELAAEVAAFNLTGTRGRRVAGSSRA